MVKRLSERKYDKQIQIINNGISLFVLESLARLIAEDLKNYMNSLKDVNDDQKKMINIIGKYDLNYLTIYLVYSDEVEQPQCWNRSIANIYIMDAIMVLKKYNNFSRKYKKKLREFLGV